MITIFLLEFSSGTEKRAEPPWPGQDGSFAHVVDNSNAEPYTA